MTAILTGFMGTGKSAVGRRVAERLGRKLHDTDAMIEQAEAMTVREIFATKGEAYFRRRETEMVAQAAQLADVVIATGGGTILNEENFAVLQQAGLMFCLNATPREIASRVRSNAADRPLLRGHTDLVARITDLLQERAPVYAKVPIQIDTHGCTVEQVADTVIAALADAELGKPSATEKG